MFSNAVTSAVGRLYAGAVSEAPRLQQVQKIEPVTKVAPSSAGSAADHGQPDHKAQRQALADGVRAVFESTVGNDADHSVGKANELARPAAEEENEVTAASDAPADPMLEDAILRFIHSVFRSIAETEGASDASDAFSSPSQAGPAAQRNPNAHLPGASSSREQLGRRIVSFADRIAGAGAESDPLTTVSTRDDELGKAFTTVVTAMGGNHPGPSTADGPTRGDLVTLMHRLAHAMQGSPPLDDGLPTVGGLLHARA